MLLRCGAMAARVHQQLSLLLRRRCRGRPLSWLAAPVVLGLVLLSSSPSSGITVWTVRSGNCSTNGAIVYSPKYPENYEYKGECDLTVRVCRRVKQRVSPLTVLGLGLAYSASSSHLPVPPSLLASPAFPIGRTAPPPPPPPPPPPRHGRFALLCAGAPVGHEPDRHHVRRVQPFRAAQVRSRPPAAVPARGVLVHQRRLARQLQRDARRKPQPAVRRWRPHRQAAAVENGARLRLPLALRGREPLRRPLHRRV